MKYALSGLLLIWLLLFTFTTLSSPVILELLYPWMVPSLQSRTPEAIQVTGCMVSSHCQNLPLNTDELFHLHEVHQLFHRLQQLQATSGLIFIVLIFQQTNKRSLLIKITDQALKIWLVAIIAIGLLALLSWETGFEQFHRLFFTPDTWSFPADSTLIQLFPEQFWQRMLLLLFCAVTVTLVSVRTILMHKPNNGKMSQ